MYVHSKKRFRLKSKFFYLKKKSFSEILFPKTLLKQRYFAKTYFIRYCHFNKNKLKQNLTKYVSLDKFLNTLYML